MRDASDQFFGKGSTQQLVSIDHEFDRGFLVKSQTYMESAFNDEKACFLPFFALAQRTDQLDARIALARDGFHKTIIGGEALQG